MHRLFTTVLCLALTLCVSAIVARPTYAQNITTGSLSGVVMDQQKAVVPGATVTATHVPTGTTYEAVTQGDGRYNMPSVRVGGPYAIKVTMVGFRTADAKDIAVGLGEDKIVSFTLQLETVQESVTVTAESPILDTTRAGTGSNVLDHTIESLPTIQRSINDFARTSPFFNVTQDGANTDAQQVSVAGRNNRYNNMQIDGAVNNDVFGLASTGTPGGQTGTQPVSLDAIQEIQLIVSPYDVRQGGFSGGGINAVTKSGTNAFHGGAYYYQRSQKLIGTIKDVATLGNPFPKDTPVGKFSDKQTGFSVGGPIVKNKAFFFTNLDWARKSTPVGYAADGTSGQQWYQQQYVQQVLDITKNVYGFDPGGLSEFSRPNNSDKYFGRVDFNLNPRNQLTVRVNYVDGAAYIGTQSATYYNMPDHFYSIRDKMLSSVVQWNSSFSQFFNELRVVYSRERNQRGDQPDYSAFPEVVVYMPDGTSQVSLGTEYSSQANALNQDIVQISDDVTWMKGEHTLTFGTQNEFYKFYNLFIQNLYGSYTFASIANYQAGIAGGYYHYFPNPDGNEAARFSVRQWGFYAGDKWRATPTLSLVYGARVDLPRFPDKPKSNPIAASEFGYPTDIVPSPTMFSARAGFNWNISRSDKQAQLRGGFGLFSGRTPYVWLSNQYGNTGMDFTYLSVNYNRSNSIPFVSDPYNQPTSVPGGLSGRQTINMIDSNYKYPQLLRGNIAIDKDLGVAGLVGTVEFLASSVLKDINYKNLNYIPNTVLPDGRTTYKKLDSSLNDVMLLTNTTQGRSWQLALQLRKPFKRGFQASGSYIYGNAYSVNDGTSSVARSNWSNTPIGADEQNTPLARSNYDFGHRVNFSFIIPIPVWKLQSSLSLFYNGQSGRRYSLGFTSDMNGEGASNDLLFVPATSDQVIVYSSVSGQYASWEMLDNFLMNDPSAKDNRGQILPRNNARGPWSNQLDLQYQITIPTPGKTRADVSINVFNFLNMLNPDWGWQYWAQFPGLPRLIGYGGLDSATGKMRYNIANIISPTFAGTFTRDNLRSRWQAQLGVRFRF